MNHIEKDAKIFSNATQKSLPYKFKIIKIIGRIANKKYIFMSKLPSTAVRIRL